MDVMAPMRAKKLCVTNKPRLYQEHIISGSPIWLLRLYDWCRDRGLSWEERDLDIFQDTPLNNRIN